MGEDRRLLEQHARIRKALWKRKAAFHILETLRLIVQLKQRGYSPRAIEEILKWYR